ncbi:hypothetical protein V8C86DRAFT_2831744 [Haematococcus lacustris]
MGQQASVAVAALAARVCLSSRCDGRHASTSPGVWCWCMSSGPAGSALPAPTWWQVRLSPSGGCTRCAAWRRGPGSGA